CGILLLSYCAGLFFSLRTHRELFNPYRETDEEEDARGWSVRQSVLVLALAGAGVALMSELLVGSIEQAARSVGLSQFFIGVVVVAIVGNAAEHWVAVMVALKDKMDLAVNIAVGSSIQIALFVAPVLVFASLLMGHSPSLDLHFTPMETVAVLASIVVLALVAQDGETHWMEGVMLLAVYGLLALAFYHQ